MGSLGYFWPYQVAAGAWQMQQDRQLLEGMRRDPRLVLRFYGWDQLTLSLGRHQVWPALGISAGIPTVQRPTGGRAVLHQAAIDQAELTYSLGIPWVYLRETLPNLKRACVYDYCCRFLVQGLAELGITVDAANRDECRIQDRLYADKTSCFAARTRADLSWRGQKLIGSAQLWQPWGILQQGSILLQPNRDLWDRYLPGSTVVGIHDICPQSPPLPGLIEHFLRVAGQCFSVDWQVQDSFLGI
ncbi:lipoyl protein ligase domain-containing protein [Thermostichus vulcanus]|uniref:Lipoate--protein ligase family protein n=1 Tax=Thermostichus vulcanus str. 'Rupite' TaxID=2813851 RepID=A0ABT0CE47_THEVL|nr:lipoate--protein ligase family protein [Thermostichus vulcanus]MCJ2544059.1 lipoate--protein ligase family protein [Thermostichus vulcanus str. 'Rupite']